jgi:hypothetical protein
MNIFAEEGVTMSSFTLLCIDDSREQAHLRKDVRSTKHRLFDCRQRMLCLLNCFAGIR